MPSSLKAKTAILSLFPENLQNIFELGSGWGNLIFPLAKRFPAAQIQAFEGSHLPWAFSWGFQKITRFPNLTIKRKNFYQVSLKEADIVVCYLYPGAMKRLKGKFLKELKPGTLVVSNTFAIPGWIPEKVVRVNDFWRSHVYLYSVPLSNS